MTIQTANLTSGEVAGTGLFDELMRTTKAHILAEFTAQRITDKNYATVYLGSVQSNLQIASQFVLQYELNNQQALVLQEQVKHQQKQNELLDLQKAQLVLANAAAEYNNTFMLPAQLASITEQTRVHTQNIVNAKEQEILLQKQVLQAVAQTLLVAKQEDLLDEQIKSEKDKTNTPLAGMNKVAYDKAIAEAALLAQRLISERAQTVGDITNLGGLLGTELALKKAQGDSFLRDAEQKVAKLYADIYSIAFSITPEGTDLDRANWKFSQIEATKAMTKLLAGINVVA